MAVFRVEKNHNYTVMSNYHLKDQNLSLRAKGLLSMMLSLPEEWNYTTRGLAAICMEGVQSIGTTLKELETSGYLVRTQRRDSKGRITDTEYVIYEQPRITEPEETEPDTPPSDAPSPYIENSDMEAAYPAKCAELNIDITNTNKSNMDLSITDTSNPNPINHNENAQENDGYDEMGYEETRETAKENIEYDILLERYPKERLDEVVDLMTETLCSRKPTIVIAGDEYPTGLVRDKLLKIDPSHIEYVFECIDKNTTCIRNIKKYILASLFNAPSTMDSYYSTLVNHHMYGSHER